jgi:hypothetical protein
MSKPPQPQDLPEIVDEPGMPERFQRTLRNLLNTSRKPRTTLTQKPKERPASKGRVHKGRTGR